MFRYNGLCEKVSAYVDSLAAIFFFFVRSFVQLEWKKARSGAVNTDYEYAKGWRLCKKKKRRNSPGERKGY